jgi:hypothetical protein
MIIMLTIVHALSRGFSRKFQIFSEIIFSFEVSFPLVLRHGHDFFPVCFGKGGDLPGYGKNVRRYAFGRAAGNLLL